MPTHTAVIDRIVDETAVIIFDDDAHDQLTLDVAALPEDARHEGAVLDMVLSEDEVEDITYRPKSERKRRKRAQDRFDRLSKRLGEE